MPNITRAGVWYEEGREPPGYVRPGGEDPQPVPELPPKSAPKAEWVEHAVQVADVDPDQAQAMTKPELVEMLKAAVEAPAPAAPDGGAPGG